ncbi:hypothetical protein FIA58_010555 [Flavobacterium jejuense]|uniref:DUF6896 domain-containing protein n=1 Tax=Flavobacterium jejuense TaxID=1544455 RepID=A0ABX0IQN0_9FLAO|nr:hypothetical protein [Flavobacterium jejuense]NHN26117.1 hypothetical protein [Flavobacterium jejuense]
MNNSSKKLLTPEEVETNQIFFEKCALEHRELATKLILELVDFLKIDITNELPYLAFVKYWQKNGQSGKMRAWKFFFHGFHCCFENVETDQYIEVPIVFGLEFGDLDPYFFTQYIKSSSAYSPLPVEINNFYEDGVTIIEKMLSLGKYEKINSNWPNHYGIVVKNRPDKVEVILFTDPLEKLEKKLEVEKKAKFNLWKFLKLK